MKIEYDKEVDAAYVYLDDKTNIKVRTTINFDKKIFFDFNHKGKLLGIEILDASKILNKKVISEAQQI
jgi:uncharacterized protein YuzE